MTETKPKTRRQLVEEARQTALNGDWLNAIEINREIITRFGRNADALNRLGRAQLETLQYASARESYSDALKVDPANMIARRNLQRLELLVNAHSTDEAMPDGDLQMIPRTSVFIEEVGKTWVDELVNPVELSNLAGISSGEQLDVVVENNRLVVKRVDGVRLGEIEAKTAERIIELMNGGNRYEVYALGLSSSSLRVILREVYRDPRNGGKVSFPRQISQTRAYLRDRDLLRQRDEADFFMLDEEDEEAEEEEAAGFNNEEDDSTVAENDSFGDEEPVIQIEDEEPRI